MTRRQQSGAELRIAGTDSKSDPAWEDSTALAVLHSSLCSQVRWPAAYWDVRGSDLLRVGRPSTV